MTVDVGSAKRETNGRFFTRQELVLKDHPHIGELFEGDVAFLGI